MKHSPGPSASLPPADFLVDPPDARPPVSAASVPASHVRKPRRNDSPALDTIPHCRWCEFEHEELADWPDAYHAAPHMSCELSERAALRDNQ